MTVRVLLDTHIALWAIAGSARLAPEAQAAILAADEVFVSAASLWEIAIKHALRKSDMPISAAQALQVFDDAGYCLLTIQPQHILEVEKLPPIHKDPFDRLLIAQAFVEPLRLITRDPLIAKYGAGIMRVA